MLSRRPQSGGVVALARGSVPATQPRVPQGVAQLSLWQCSSGSSERTSDSHRAAWQEKFPRIHSSKGKRISYNRLLSWSGCAALGQGLLSVLWEESMLKTSENVVFILVQI